MCAENVRTDPDLETRLVLLGVGSVEEYMAWILDDRHWGGEPEILMIAQHYNVEVRARPQANFIQPFPQHSGEAFRPHAPHSPHSHPRPLLSSPLLPPPPNRPFLFPIRS